MNKVHETRSGYYLDLPKVGRSQLSRHYYHDDTVPALVNGKIVPHVQNSLAYNPKLEVELDNFFQKQSGGNLFSLAFENIYNILLPLNKEQLIATIALFVLEYFNTHKNKEKIRKQSGGFLSGVQTVLGGMNKNALLVILVLFLAKYITSTKKMVGGSNFQQKLIKIINYNRFHNIKGTMAPFNNKINIINLSSLASNLNKIIIQKGGGKNEQLKLAKSLYKTLQPLGINKFLTKINIVNKKQYGGDYDYNQFGCRVLDWGEGLEGCI